MKILYFLDQFFPEQITATEYPLFNLAAMLQILGHKVKVITGGSCEDSLYDPISASILFREFVYKGIPAVAFKPNNIYEDLNYAADVAEIAEYIMEIEKPDMVHIAYPMKSSELVDVLYNLITPYVITCPSICSELDPQPIKDLPIDRNIFCKAKFITAPSKFVAGIYKQAFPELNIAVIPPGTKGSSITRHNRQHEDHDDLTIEQEAYIYERIYRQIIRI